MAEVTLRYIQTGMTLHEDGSVASLQVPEAELFLSWGEGIQSADAISDIVDNAVMQANTYKTANNITDAMVETNYNELGITLVESKDGTTYETTGATPFG